MPVSEETRWEAQNRIHPGHSARYIERFEALSAEGKDLHGEARLVDAMAPRHARILDAGSGTGRVGGELARRGHTVTGVDLDAALVAAARRDYPAADWLVGNLALLALPAHFDVVVCAGNVLPFLAPGSEPEVLRRLRNCLAPAGRLVVGFGAGRAYTFGQFFADAGGAGLERTAVFSTWDLRPWSPSSDFLVAVLDRARNDARTDPSPAPVVTKII